MFANILVTGLVDEAAADRRRTGSHFDMAKPPTAIAAGYADGAIVFGNVTGPYLQLDNSADLIGIHLVAAIKPGPIAKGRVFGSTLGNTVRWTSGSATGLTWYFSNNGTSVSSDPIAANTNAWHIAEMRFDGAAANVLWDGLHYLKDHPHPSPTFPVRQVGAINSSTQGPIAIGDFCSVICAPGYNSAPPEPAVLMARRTLAARSGVAL